MPSKYELYLGLVDAMHKEWASGYQPMTVLGNKHTIGRLYSDSPMRSCAINVDGKQSVVCGWGRVVLQVQEDMADTELKLVSVKRKPLYSGPVEFVVERMEE